MIPIKQDGVQEGLTSATLAPKHSTTVILSNTAGVSHVIIRSSGWFRGDRPVVANAFINNYNPGVSGAVTRTDFAVVSGVPESAAPAATTLPYFAQGEDFFSVVRSRQPDQREADRDVDSPSQQRFSHFRFEKPGNNRRHSRIRIQSAIVRRPVRRVGNGVDKRCDHG